MKTKGELKPDTVESAAFHVGIELETIIACESSHDDEACDDSYRESLESDGAEGVLRHRFGLSRSQAQDVESYFNFDSYVDDQVADHACEDRECSHYGNASGDDQREELETTLKRASGNESFKVVSDGSINHDTDETDAEVCWNYFASKDTVKDNAKVLKVLKDHGARFNTSCGLHINLNNYLKLPEPSSINTEALSFLFNLVAPSRRTSTYCSSYAISASTKYSMIYYQGDRLEFRFFSPTFEADKLNAYVSLANFIYRRLAGQNRKLPAKLKAYLREKMIKTNGHSEPVADFTLAMIESIPALSELGKRNSQNSEYDSFAESRAERLSYIA